MGRTATDMDSLNSESAGRSSGKVGWVQVVAVNCQKQSGHGDPTRQQGNIR